MGYPFCILVASTVVEPVRGLIALIEPETSRLPVNLCESSIESPKILLPLAKL